MPTVLGSSAYIRCCGFFDVVLSWATSSDIDHTAGVRTCPHKHVHAWYNYFAFRIREHLVHLRGRGYGLTSWREIVGGLVWVRSRRWVRCSSAYSQCSCKTSRSSDTLAHCLVSTSGSYNSMMVTLLFCQFKYRPSQQRQSELHYLSNSLPKTSAQGLWDSGVHL